MGTLIRFAHPRSKPTITHTEIENILDAERGNGWVGIADTDGTRSLVNLRHVAQLETFDTEAHERRTDKPAPLPPRTVE